MIDVVPVLFVSGMLLGLLSGVLTVRAYFIFSDDGSGEIGGPNRPNVWKRVKNYRTDPTQENDATLIKLYNWIYVTRQTSLGLIILAFVTYFVIFSFGQQ